jgi:2-polyprenyl-3-methyl-5-hydroxy-6-metoxy-1,4-benzoquinol methylase
MSFERYQFGHGSEYNSFQSAHALMRYDLLRPICAGKRVLDVACGEAYGSFLLARWGAAEVVGVDISAQAIESSRNFFAHPRVRYYVGDVLKLAEVLGESEPFDIIVAFETIEHVSDVKQFLTAVCKYRGRNGVVAISCPNGAAGLDVGEVNKFHQRQFTFEEFQKATTSTLGGANQWLIGTPIVGGVHYASNDPGFESPNEDPKAIVTGKQGPRVTTLAPHLGAQPSNANCIHYVGVWGTTLETNVVLAPISLNGVIEPWKKLSWLTAERSRYEQLAQERLATIQQLRRRILFYVEERLRLEKRFRESEQALEKRFRESEQALESRAANWRNSRGYRVLQAYYRLYSVPIFRIALVRLRPFLAFFFRARRRSQG